MPYQGDPPGDTVSDRIEIKLRNLLAASSDFDGIKVFYRGEPGFVPVKLYPFVIVFLSEETEASGEGYNESTGLRYYRYDGYISLEVIHKDTSESDARRGPLRRGGQLPRRKRADSGCLQRHHVVGWAAGKSRG